MSPASSRGRMSDLQSLLRERAESAGIPLDPAIEPKLVAYLELLWKWNRKINLTAIVEPEIAIDRLLLEPLAAAIHLPAGGALADLGSGGGSPAIPLALALSAPRLLMVESRSRKASFLREAARTVALDAEVLAVRFEDLRADEHHAARADVVSMRAVRPDTDTLSLAAWLAKPGGTIALITSVLEAEQLDTRRPGCSTWNITPSAMLVTFHVKQNS
jgi:16S rRNA (guanine527-N7)-methyltransferase